MGVLTRRREVRNAPTPYSTDDVLKIVLGGQQYDLLPGASLKGVPVEKIDVDFSQYVTRIYRRHGIVAACVAFRQRLVSQARFVLADDDTGNREPSPVVDGLHHPGGTRTRSRWLRQYEADVSLAGNGYVFDRDRDPRDDIRARGGRIVLRPDLIDIVIGSDQDIEEASTQLDGDVVGYAYYPNGRNRPAVPLAVGTVAHWMPEPDPLARWRGTSWVTSVVREITSDGQVTEFGQRFFENGGTPNTVVKVDPRVTDVDEFERWVEVFESTNAGIGNSWKNWYLGGGSDVKVVGQGPGDVALKDLRHELESRVVARAGLSGVLVGVPSSATTGGSVMASGNYLQVRRSSADTFVTPHLDDLCEALQAIVDVPAGRSLTFDPNRILFMQEDRKDAAEIEAKKAQTIRTYVDGGFTPESVVAAVDAEDVTLLKHSGKLSVQLIADSGQDGAGEEGDT